MKINSGIAEMDSLCLYGSKNTDIEKNNWKDKWPPIISQSIEDLLTLITFQWMTYRWQLQIGTWAIWKPFQEVYI